MATLKFYLDNRRPKSDGTASLKISVSQARAVRYISTGISISPDVWDAATCKITAKHPCHLRLNHTISSIMLRAEGAFLNLTLSGEPYTFDDLLRAVAKAVDPERPRAEKKPRDLILPVFETFLATKIKPKTAESYKITLKHLKSFCPDFSKLRFEEVTRSWLMQFDAFLAKTAKSPNARAVYMRDLRAVFNFAIDEGITTWYPFRKFHIKTIRTAKRSLPVEDLRRLFSMPIEPWQEQYRDFYKLSFLLIGVNAVDLLGADHKSIINGRLEFNRSKTSRLYSIKIEPEAAELLDQYRGEGHLLQCMDVCGNYKFYLQRANKVMKSLGEVTRSGLGGKKTIKAEFPDISSYWMRHSWATIAASLDIPKETIAAALGHGGNTVTDIYIDFDQKKVDAANRKVIDYVFGTKKEG